MGSTIVIEDKANITIQGGTYDFDDTVIKGLGINNAAVKFNISITSSPNATIKNLTLAETYYHGVKIADGGVSRGDDGRSDRAGSCAGG